MKTVQNLLIFILLLCIHQLQAQNNALDFNGSSNYISVPAKASYDLTTGTIECLVKPSSFGSGLTILGVRGAGGTRYSIHLRQNSVNMWNGTTSAQLSYAFTLGVWYHVAFVCIGPTETKCYINGSLIGSVGYGFGYATG